MSPDVARSSSSRCHHRTTRVTLSLRHETLIRRRIENVPIDVDRPAWPLLRLRWQRKQSKGEAEDHKPCHISSILFVAVAFGKARGTMKVPVSFL
jgi:hypothetical protein